MRLFGYWRSSCSWRVRAALDAKGVEYTNVPVHLKNAEQRAQSHTRINPLQQVPVLELPSGQRLTQSVAILEYIEEAYPEPRLLPEAAIARARVRQAVEIINSGIQPLQNLKVLQALDTIGGDRMAWGRQVIHEGFVALEALATQTAGRCLVGDQLTLADICLVPQVYNARRFSVDLAPFPTLSRVEAFCQAQPAFQSSHPDRQPDAP